MAYARPVNARDVPRPEDFYGPEGWGAHPPRTTPLPREHVALELIRPFLGDGRRFADIGCGNGSFLDFLRSAAPGLDLIGVDASRHQLSVARRHVPGTRLVEADLHDGMPFEQDALDGIYAGEIIEHLVDPDAFLRECRRVLRPDGVLLVTTPNLCAWYNRVLFVLGSQPLFVEVSTQSTLVGAGVTSSLRISSRPVGHIRVFSSGAIADLLELHGFSILSRRAAPFDGLTGPLHHIDRAVSALPTLGSISVVLARA